MLRKRVHTSSFSQRPRLSAVGGCTTRLCTLQNARLRVRQQPSALNAKPIEDGPSFDASPEDGCASLFPLHDDLLRDLAQMQGVRVVMDTQAAVEEDEEEDWDEVMSELTDPWMADPPTTSDRLEDLGTLAAATEVQPPRIAAEVEVVQDAQQLQALIQQHSGSLVLLDIRTHEEFEAGPSISGSINCPIQSLTGDAAKKFAAQPVLVLGTADYRGSQACIRLTKVYGALTVYYFEPGISAWPAGLQLHTASG